MVSLEQAEHPPLHLRRGRTHGKQIRFVHNHHHRLFVNQLIQVRNDASLSGMGAGFKTYGQIHRIAHKQNQRVLLEGNSVYNFLRNRRRDLISLHRATVSQLHSNIPILTYFVTPLTEWLLSGFQIGNECVLWNIAIVLFVLVLQFHSTTRATLNFLQLLPDIHKSLLHRDRRR